MDFGDVIKGMRADMTMRYTRKAWGPGTYIQHMALEDWFQMANLFDLRESSIVRCVSGRKGVDPCWFPSQSDMLADDWEVVA